MEHVFSESVVDEAQLVLQLLSLHAPLGLKLGLDHRDQLSRMAILHVLLDSEDRCSVCEYNDREPDYLID